MKRHPLSAARDGRKKNSREAGIATVLDEELFEPAESYDLIDSARDGQPIALDIDAD